jgi:mono/diheme cytochrome c family protein
MGRIRRCLTGLMGAVALSVLAVTALGSVQAQQPAQGLQNKPYPGLTSVEGKDTFAALCAVCHGADGKGSGPAASVLKIPPADLTTIAKRHGRFDEVRIEQTILGAGKVPPAHGTETMPIWGPVFRSTESRELATLRVRNLVQFLKSLQS